MNTTRFFSTMIFVTLAMHGIQAAADDDTIGEPWSKYELDSHAVATLMTNEKVTSKLRQSGGIKKIERKSKSNYVIRTETCTLEALYETVDCPGDDSTLSCGEEPLFCTRVTIVSTSGGCRS